MQERPRRLPLHRSVPLSELNLERSIRPWTILFSTPHPVHFTDFLLGRSSCAQGFGEKTTAFSTLDPIAAAEFVVRKGTAVGFVLNNVIYDVGVQRSGSVGKTSEVWFVKQE